LEYFILHSPALHLFSCRSGVPKKACRPFILLLRIARGKLDAPRTARGPEDLVISDTLWLRWTRWFAPPLVPPFEIAFQPATCFRISPCNRACDLRPPCFLLDVFSVALFTGSGSTCWFFFSGRPAPPRFLLYFRRSSYSELPSLHSAACWMDRPSSNTSHQGPGDRRRVFSPHAFLVVA